jgi:hypothetical protein
MATSVFTKSFVKAVKDTIRQQLKDDGQSTRASVCKALELEGHDSCISVLLETGLLPEFRLVKRIGIVDASYQTGKEKAVAEAVAKATAAANPPAPPAPEPDLVPVLDVKPATTEPETAPTLAPPPAAEEAPTATAEAN